MNYTSILVIGIVIIIIFSIQIVYTTFKSVKNKEKLQKYFIKLALILFLFFFTGIAYFSAAYNTLCTRIVKLIDQQKYRDAIYTLEKTLLIRSIIGKSSKYFDKEILGYPLFYLSEQEVRLKLAELYSSMKEYENAIKEYSKILSIEKDNYEALYGLAEILLLTKNLESSRYYFDKFIKVKPKKLNADYYFNLGKAYMVLLDFEKSLRAFNKSIELGKEEILVKIHTDKIKKHINKVRIQNLE